MVDKKEAREFVLEILQRLDGFAEARLEYDCGWIAWSLAVNFKDGSVGYLCAVLRNRRRLYGPTKLYVRYELDDEQFEDVLWSRVVDCYLQNEDYSRKLGLYQIGLCQYAVDELRTANFRSKDFIELPWVESRSLDELRVELDLKGLRR